MGMLDKLIKKEDSIDIEDKTLEFENIDLKAQLNAYKKYVESVEEERNLLDDSIKNFCKTVLDTEYAKSQIYGGDLVSLKGINLLNAISKKIIEKDLNYNNNMMLLINEGKEKDSTIESLQRQVIQFLENKDIENKDEIMDLVLKNTNNKENPPKQEDIIVNPIVEPTKTEDTYSAPKITGEDLSELKNITKEAQRGSIIDKLINKEVGEEPVTVIEIKDKDIQSNSVVPDNRKNTANKNLKSKNKEDDKDNKPIAHVIDLKDIMDKMPELHWRIIESIAIKKFSENGDIADSLREYYEDIKNLPAKTKSGLVEMVNSNILIKEKVVTGWRTFFVYSLSETGKRIFKESDIFKGKTIELCEKEVLIKQHSTVNHGYGIKDSANMLISQGYKDVSYFPEDNKIELPNGDIYIPDITGNNPITGEKEYFEFELVHHKQDDFNKKCNKMKTITDKLFFITTTENKREQLKSQINCWRYNMGDKVKDLEVFVTTTRALKNGKWDTAD